LANQLLDLAREAIGEAAKTRFQANFGTDVCQHCRGLKAGPGVGATCFQMQACYYNHFRADELTPKHERIVGTLLKVANPQKGT